MVATGIISLNEGNGDKQFAIAAATVVAGLLLFLLMTFLKEIAKPEDE